jgi:hypothetical protein
MHQEAAFAGQDERVQNAQHPIDGVRIRGLSHPAPFGFRIPLGAEVAPLHHPASGLESHAQVFVVLVVIRSPKSEVRSPKSGFRFFVLREPRIPNPECRLFHQFDVQLHRGLRRARSYKFPVAVFEQVSEISTVRADKDGYAANVKGKRVNRNQCRRRHKAFTTEATEVTENRSQFWVNKQTDRNPNARRQKGFSLWSLCAPW